MSEDRLTTVVRNSGKILESDSNVVTTAEESIFTTTKLDESVETGVLTPIKVKRPDKRRTFTTWKITF